MSKGGDIFEVEWDWVAIWAIIWVTCGLALYGALRLGMDLYHLAILVMT